jgi:hypothetical protein
VDRNHLAQGKGPQEGSFKHGNESSGSIKGGEFLCQLSDCQLLMRDSAMLVHSAISQPRPTRQTNQGTAPLPEA